jgi:hypothetical protein
VEEGDGCQNPYICYRELGGDFEGKSSCDVYLFAEEDGKLHNALTIKHAIIMRRNKIW